MTAAPYPAALVARRQRLGLTRLFLARRIGVHVNTVYLWESGHHDCPADGVDAAEAAISEVEKRVLAELLELHGEGS